MKNKEKQDDPLITTFSDTITIDSCTFTGTNTGVINYTVDTNSTWILASDGTDFFTYNDPYQEFEKTKQQQEKEEELREENSCLQEAWNEYQLILKLLEENECDKFLEERYGMNK